MTAEAERRGGRGHRWTWAPGDRAPHRCTNLLASHPRCHPEVGKSPQGNAVHRRPGLPSQSVGQLRALTALEVEVSGNRDPTSFAFCGSQRLVGSCSLRLSCISAQPCLRAFGLVQPCLGPLGTGCPVDPAVAWLPWGLSPHSEAASVTWPDLSLGSTEAWRPPRTGDQGVEWEVTSSRVEAVVPEPRRWLPSLTGLWCWGAKPLLQGPGRGGCPRGCHTLAQQHSAHPKGPPRPLSFPQTNTCHTSHFTPNLGLHGF